MKKLFFWFNKIEVVKESTFHCVGKILGTRILIKGVDNHIEILENTNILNYDIVIKGKDNSFKFGKNCTANGNYVNLTMWKDEDETNNA